MGRVCPQDRLCEGDCTLNDGHGAVTIGAIEQYITEKGFKKGLKLEFPKKRLGKKVAIIGSGPAGLSLATYLLRGGVDVVMYERAKKAGGLLTYGIPPFKLDKHIVENRVNQLIHGGMILKTDCEIGKNISFDEVVNQHDVTFIGIGVTKPKSLNIPNEDAKGIFPAMEYLTNVQKKLFNEDFNTSLNVKNRNVIVIGGGDTAMDCVRTALREGAKSVTCHYRRDDNNMPGSFKEYQNAIEEGCNFRFYSTPKKILTDSNGYVKSVVFATTELSEPDQTGRQTVTEIDDSEEEFPADIVITALGFNPVQPKFLIDYGIKFNSWGGIITDEKGETSVKNIYAGGDVVRGADLVVRASYDGREIASNIINSFLNFKEN
jgi:glutamate synthase (NADPH/NADH) small chain